MTTRREALRRGGLLLAALGGPAASASAQATSPIAGSSRLAGLGLPELHVRITQGSFVAASPSMPAGLVLLVVENGTEEQETTTLIGPPAGMSMPDFQARIQSSSAPAFGLPAWLDAARVTGGPITPGEQTGYAVIQAEPGDWLIAGQGNRRPALVTIADSNASPRAAQEPEADLSITMRDFAFDGLPRQVAAGRQIWKVTNAGPSLHMLIAQTIPAGVTLEQIRGVFANLGPNGTPAPDAPIHQRDFGPAMGQEISSSGYTTWIELEFAPGDYFIGCYVADSQTGTLHAYMGMAAILTAAAGATEVIT